MQTRKVIFLMDGIFIISDEPDNLANKIIKNDIIH